jgi:hypothetical protein
MQNLIACLPCVPDGFELVTEGKIEEGDLISFPLDDGPICNFATKNWFAPIISLKGLSIEESSEKIDNFCPVVRKIK